MDETQLEAASDAVGAMTFARPEDGAFNPRTRERVLLRHHGRRRPAPTSSAVCTRCGWTGGNPTLTVVYNADQVVAAGGDIAISPDNIDASRQYLMINEDGTDREPAGHGREGPRRVDLAVPGRQRQARGRRVERDPRGPARSARAQRRRPVGPGIWETSGIIDMSHIWGPNTWLFDVQAHPPTPVPAANTVEDGQLLMMVPAA